MKTPGDDLGGLRDELLSKNGEKLDVTERIGIDEMLERWTGEFGRWQIKHFLLSSLAWTLEAFHTMVMIFADYEPHWHCNGEKTPEDFLSMKPRFESCSPTGSICSMDRASWDWDGGAGVSTVSEWDLVCGQKYKVGFLQSAFFVGCLLGAGIFGHLSDSSLGRKGVLRLVCICNAIFGFLTAMSPNFWVYLILRLLTGISSGGLGLSSFVLATEAVGPSKRGPVGMSTFYFFSLGIAVLPALSYFSGNWRYLYVASSIPSALYCIFVLPFVSESPRWYLVKGRLQEAMGIMRSIAAKNGKSLPAGVSLALAGDEQDAADSDESSGSLVDVFRSPVTRTRMVLMAFIWLACGVGYYGLSLNVVNLSTSLYLSVFLNGIAEMPAFALTAVMLEKFGRRAMLVSTMLLSGVASVLGGLTSALLHVHSSNPNSTMGMPSWVPGRMLGFLSGMQLACGVVAIFGMAGTYNLIFIYTCELFPTVVRNAALGLASEAGQIGAIIAPLVVVVMVTVNPSLPFAIIGVSGIVGGFLAFKLPETLHRPLYETMAALEHAESTTCV